MRQLAGGLRERDIDDFARELADLARRNPGVFLAGSVALGFGIARFFKARVPQSANAYRGESGQSTGGWQGLQESAHGRPAYDAEEDLDFSARSTQWRDTQDDSGSQRGSGWQDGSSGSQGGAMQSGASSPSGSASQSGGGSQGEHDGQQHERNAGKSRQASKHKAKPQRASSAGAQQQSPSTDSTSTGNKTPEATTGGSTDSAFTGGTGGGALRGGKS
jgi:hypothetical protein